MYSPRFVISNPLKGKATIVAPGGSISDGGSAFIRNSPGPIRRIPPSGTTGMAAKKAAVSSIVQSLAAPNASTYIFEVAMCGVISANYAIDTLTICVILFPRHTYDYL